MAEKIQRRTFIRASSILTLGMGAYRPEFSLAGASVAAAGKLPYKMIYDDDSVNIFPSEEPASPEQLDRYIDKVADAGADLYLQCTGYHRVFYESKVWEPWWEEYKKKGTVYGKKVEGGWINASPFVQLAEMGVDFLEHALKRCRERNMASGLTVRMDDLHYRGPSLGEHTVSERLSRFYLDEDMYLPEEEFGRHGGRWALNYERPEVREHYLSLFRELVELYDFDVLSLDYMRHPPYFDRKDIDRHCDTMTEFLGEINKIFRSAGKKISLLARVPATPANCREQGLDVGAWAREGLINGIAPGMKNCTGWEIPVKAFRPLVGENVAVYAANERQAGRTSVKNTSMEAGDDSSALRWTREMFRGYAAGHLANGADGIYLFNFFLGNIPIIDVLGEMKSLEGLRGKRKAYRLTTYGSQHAVEVDLPMQIPVSIPANQARRLEMLLAAESAGVQAEALVILDRPVEPDNVWLQLNDTPLGHALQVVEKPVDGMYYSWWNIVEGTSAAVFNIPASALRDGRNHLVVRNEGEYLTVLGMVIRTS